jgi:hypothetical protein
MSGVKATLERSPAQPGCVCRPEPKNFYLSVPFNPKEAPFVSEGLLICSWWRAVRLVMGEAAPRSWKSIGIKSSLLCGVWDRIRFYYVGLRKEVPLRGTRLIRKRCIGALVLILWFTSVIGLHAQQAPRADDAKAPAQERSPAAPKKPAWQWTVDERLAKRFDPAQMKARAAEHDAEQKALEELNRVNGSDPLFSIPPDAAPTMTIDGRKTPELFLTEELFTTLLGRAFPPGGEHMQQLRGPIERRAAALGFGRDLWPRLEKVAAPLRKLEAEQKQPGDSPSTPVNIYKMDAQSVRFCRVRAQVIAAAKKEFGEEAFLRLLYEALAPEVRLTYPIYPRMADHIRFMEEGCR